MQLWRRFFFRKNEWTCGSAPQEARPPPHCWLYSSQPCQPPKGSIGWEMLVEEVAPPQPPLVHLGPQLWLGHRHPWVQGCCWRAGGHYMIQPAPLSSHMCASLPFPGTDVCTGNTHIAFFSFPPIRGREGGTGQLTSPLGKGQVSWCQCGLGCPSSAQDLPKPPQCLSASPACQACLCSSSEQRGTGGGFSLEPEVNYALLDNFQLPVLAIKWISSRWHAYLCAGRKAHQAASPQDPGDVFSGNG